MPARSVVRIGSSPHQLSGVELIRPGSAAANIVRMVGSSSVIVDSRRCMVRARYPDQIVLVHARGREAVSGGFVADGRASSCDHDEPCRS